jgi:predicted outer membrane protein
MYRTILTCLACGALLCAPLFAARRHQSKAFNAQDFVNAVAQEQMLQVNLARMVDTHSANRDVRQLSTQIVEQQTSAYHDLQAVAKKLNLTLPKGIDNAGNKRIDALSKQYRQPFNKLFLKEEADSANREADALQDAADHATDPVLKQYATAQLPKVKLNYEELKDFAHYHLEGK